MIFAGLLFSQCADLGELIERNKNTTTQSDGYDATSRIWTGIEIVAQLEMLGINATKFANLQVVIVLERRKHFDRRLSYLGFRIDFFLCHHLL